MAVVTGQSDLYGADVDPAKARGRPVIAAFTVAALASDNSGSKYKLASIPSYAILSPGTIFKGDAWAFATLNVGTISNATALGTVARASAATWQPITANGSLHGLPLWQALGLAADPGGNIDLYAHAPADATAAGTLRGEIHYRFR